MLILSVTSLLVSGSALAGLFLIAKDQRARQPAKGRFFPCPAPFVQAIPRADSKKLIGKLRGRALRIAENRP